MYIFIYITPSHQEADESKDKRVSLKELDAWLEKKKMKEIGRAHV